MTRGETGVMARGPREQWHVDNPPHPQSQTGSDCTSLAPKTEGPSRIGIMVYGARRNLTDVLKRFPAGGRIKAEHCPSGTDCTSPAPKTEGPSRIGIMVYDARRNLTDVLKRFPAGGRIKAERCPSGSDC